MWRERLVPDVSRAMTTVPVRTRAATTHLSPLGADQPSPPPPTTMPHVPRPEAAEPHPHGEPRSAARLSRRTTLDTHARAPERPTGSAGSAEPVTCPNAAAERHARQRRTRRRRRLPRMQGDLDDHARQRRDRPPRRTARPLRRRRTHRPLISTSAATIRPPAPHQRTAVPGRAVTRPSTDPVIRRRNRSIDRPSAARRPPTPRTHDRFTLHDHERRHRHRTRVCDDHIPRSTSPTPTITTAIAAARPSATKPNGSRLTSQPATTPHHSQRHHPRGDTRRPRQTPRSHPGRQPFQPAIRRHIHPRTHIRTHDGHDVRTDVTRDRFARTPGTGLATHTRTHGHNDRTGVR